MKTLTESRFKKLVSMAEPVLEDETVLVDLKNNDWELVQKDGYYTQVKSLKNKEIVYDLTEEQIYELEEIIEMYEPKTCGNCSEQVSEDEDFCSSSCEKEHECCAKYDNR